MESQLLPTSISPRSLTARLIGADAMLGTDVVDCEGARVGELKDMLLDLRLGRIAYGVVALERAPDWSEGLIAVPWNVLQFDGSGELKVNARKDWVEHAPSMQLDMMAALLDHEWAVFIHSYFGAKPYWERNAQHA